MTIDWSAFTPASALFGGALIGLASALFLLGNRRVTGIAGIVAGPLRALLARGGMARDRPRLWFIVGLLVAPSAWALVAPMPSMRIDVGALGVGAAGLLAGVGVRLGNGCTSGHGVCGLSRFVAAIRVGMVIHDQAVARF